MVISYVPWKKCFNKINDKLTQISIALILFLTLLSKWSSQPTTLIKPMLAALQNQSRSSAPPAHCAMSQFEK